MQQWFLTDFFFFWAPSLETEKYSFVLLVNFKLQFQGGNSPTKNSTLGKWNHGACLQNECKLKVFKSLHWAKRILCGNARVGLKFRDLLWVLPNKRIPDHFSEGKLRTDVQHGWKYLLQLIYIICTKMDLLATDWLNAVV